MQTKGNAGEAAVLLIDWLILAYADGKTDVESQLGGSVETSIDSVMDVITADVGGENVLDRVEEYIYLEDYDAIIRVADNERERVYNTAAYDTATKLNAKSKTWHTMQDNRVRDTHDYLEGMTKPMNEAFYTYTGDSAQYPMAFNDAENNIGCRCWLTYSN